MLSGTTKILKFMQHHKSIKALANAYADFECLIKNRWMQK